MQQEFFLLNPIGEARVTCVRLVKRVKGELECWDCLADPERQMSDDSNTRFCEKRAKALLGYHGQVALLASLFWLLLS